MAFKKTTNKKRDKKAFESKSSKAQHLVEFVLFFPFLIGIIGVLTEIAYGLNTGIELNSALSSAVYNASFIYRTQENSSKETIEKEIYENTYKILKSRKVPYINTLKIETLDTEGFYVTIGSYNYTYAFKLVNLFFSAIPDKFYFKSVIITNKSLFLPNDYKIYDDDLIYDFSTSEKVQSTQGDEFENP